MRVLGLLSVKSSNDLLTVISFSLKSRHISLEDTRYAPAPNMHVAHSYHWLQR